MKEPLKDLEGSGQNASEETPLILQQIQPYKYSKGVEYTLRTSIFGVVGFLARNSHVY